jgi:FkbM family methyltransferase
MHSHGDDWVSNQVFWRGWSGYEPETSVILFRASACARVVLDVGAHVGFVTLLAAHANPEAEVHSFEPMPAVFARLERNVALNRRANVVCNACAAGESDGSLELFHGDSEIPSSSSLSYQFMSGLLGGRVRSTRVPVVALDEYVHRRGISRVDLVKIDTESTEPGVLRGMRQTLERDRPTIVCEVLPDAKTGPDLQGLLGPLGYRYYHLTPDGPSWTHSVEPHPRWMNYLFSVSDPGDFLDRRPGKARRTE